MRKSASTRHRTIVVARRLAEAARTGLLPRQVRIVSRTVPGADAPSYWLDGHTHRGHIATHFLIGPHRGAHMHQFDTNDRPLDEILTKIAQEKRSGSLEVRSDESRARIRFADGRIAEVHRASSGETLPPSPFGMEEDVYAIFGWATGEYEFVEAPAAPLTGPTLDALELAHEIRRQHAALSEFEHDMPSPYTILQVSSNPDSLIDPIPISRIAFPVLAQVGNRTTREIIEGSGLSRFRAMDQLHSLLELCVVEPAGRKVPKEEAARSETNAAAESARVSGCRAVLEVLGPLQGLVAQQLRTRLGAAAGTVIERCYKEHAEDFPAVAAHFRPDRQRAAIDFPSTTDLPKDLYPYPLFRFLSRLWRTEVEHVGKAFGPRERKTALEHLQKSHGSVSESTRRAMDAAFVWDELEILVRECRE